MKTRFGICFFIFSFCLGAKANLDEGSCPNKDYADQFGPVRAQGASNDCFAFAAADLIGFAQGVKAPEQISAMDVITDYITMDPQKILAQRDKATDFGQGTFAATRMYNQALYTKAVNDGQAPWDRNLTQGNMALAIFSYNLKSGLCLEKDSPAQNAPPAKARFDFLMNRMSHFDPRLHPSAAVVPTAVRETDPGFRCPTEKANLLEPLLDFQQRLNNYQTMQIKAMVEKECKRQPMKPMKVQTFSSTKAGSGQTSQFLAQQLAAGRPVGVQYDADFLVLGPDAPLTGTSNHASVIVASRWNADRKICEFKIRNSFGMDATNYSADLLKTFDHGHVWVTEKDIQDRVTNAVAIE